MAQQFSCSRTKKGFTCFRGGRRTTRRRRRRSPKALFDYKIPSQPLGFFKRASAKVGNVLSKGLLPLGVKTSKKQKALIGGAAIGIGAWWILSYFKVLPAQLDLLNILKTSPLGWLGGGVFNPPRIF